MGSASRNAVFVVGPTAAGKTRMGVAVARRLGGEVVSADSRQVYRGLDIGAGKDLDAYAEGGPPVPYHLIDIVDLDHEFSVFEYQQRCFEVVEALWNRDTVPIVVGGTGLYIDAVLRGYRMVEAPENPALRAELDALPDEALEARLRALRPRLHNTTDLTSRARTVRAIEIAAYTADHPPAPAPAIRPVVLGARWPREELRRRIGARLRGRVAAGLIEEVYGLLESGVPPERLDRLGLEYRYVTRLLRGKIEDAPGMVRELYPAICQFAKRQETWFRRMERQGVAIHWIDRADTGSACRAIDNLSLANINKS
jgi:tRNA dimethylallyltransferase